MKVTLSNVLMFIAGAGIGSAVAWRVLKSKYEKIAKEEIESVKAVFTYKKPETEQTEVEEVESSATNEEQLAETQEYLSIVRNNYSADAEKARDTNKPYIIRPDEFGDLDGYDTDFLTYYADEVLADDRDNIIEDVDGVVGSDFKHRFGEHGEDSVFVRNDEMEIDYEIVQDPRKFSEAVSINSHYSEDE